MSFLVLAIFEYEGVEKYLKKRNLLKQFKKAKNCFLVGNFQQINLKKRRPVHDKMYSFRINKKYRAFGYFCDTKNFITEISDHQRP